MGFDLGAYAAIGQDAAKASAAAAAAQALGGYGTSLDVKPAKAPATAAVPLATSLPKETTAVDQPGFLAKYWKWLALAGAALALVVVMGRRKRR